jgi:hypothetical protein
MAKKKATYKGKTYSSLTSLHHACAIKEISYSCFWARLNRGWSYKNALTKKKPQRFRYSAGMDGSITVNGQRCSEEIEPAPNPILFRDISYATRKDLTESHGIDYLLFASRIDNGWFHDEALELVERGPENNDRYNEKYFQRISENKNIPAKIYLVHFKKLDGNDSFYKIGIATRTLNGRFDRHEFRDFDITKFQSRYLSLYEAWQLEELFFEEYRDVCVQREDIVFGGRAKCFRFNADQAGSLAKMIRQCRSTIFP